MLKFFTSFFMLDYLYNLNLLEFLIKKHFKVLTHLITFNQLYLILYRFILLLLIFLKILFSQFLKHENNIVPLKECLVGGFNLSTIFYNIVVGCEMHFHSQITFVAFPCSYIHIESFPDFGLM